jgi:hypothetical protein
METTSGRTWDHEEAWVECVNFVCHLRIVPFESANDISAPQYTRRRRWQRRAVCTEEVTYIPGQAETASSASDAVKLENRGSSSSDVMSKNKTTSIGYTLELPSGAASPATVPATVMTGTAKSEQPEAGLRRDSHSSERDHVLRQRLKNVMANVGS